MQTTFPCQLHSLYVQNEVCPKKLPGVDSLEAVANKFSQVNGLCRIGSRLVIIGRCVRSYPARPVTQDNCSSSGVSHRLRLVACSKASRGSEASGSFGRRFDVADPLIAAPGRISSQGSFAIAFASCDSNSRTATRSSAPAFSARATVTEPASPAKNCASNRRHRTQSPISSSTALAAASSSCTLANVNLAPRTSAKATATSSG